RRDAEVADERRELSKEDERLKRATAQLQQARLRFNGEVQLSRRKLAAGWDHLRERQAELLKRVADLEQREAVLDRRAHELTEESDRRQEFLVRLGQEAQDLEYRVLNSRRKLLEHEKELKQLATASNSCPPKSSAKPDSPRK